MPWPNNFFWCGGAGTSSEYLVWMPRSWGQNLCHVSKKWQGAGLWWVSSFVEICLWYNLLDYRRSSEDWRMMRDVVTAETVAADGASRSGRVRLWTWSYSTTSASRHRSWTGLCRVWSGRCTALRTQSCQRTRLDAGLSVECHVGFIACSCLTKCHPWCDREIACQQRFHCTFMQPLIQWQILNEELFEFNSNRVSISLGFGYIRVWHIVRHSYRYYSCPHRCYKSLASFRLILGAHRSPITP